MTSGYLTSITPDSFSGLIFGFEGVENVVVLLNGPTGCKFYHSATADHQTMRRLRFDPFQYPELWYFGQPRVPCTYLDKRDYVYGSRDKLTDAIAFIEEKMTADLLVIVNSPGEALIGDDLKQVAQAAQVSMPIVTVETPGYSRFIWDGYDMACQALIRQLLPEKVEKKTDPKKKVNLLGLSIFHNFHEGDRRELTRLLNLCGIEVNCALCCDSSLASIYALPGADLNVVLDPAYGLGSAKLLEERYGIPYIAQPQLPVGFTNTEALLRDICAALHCDPAPFLEESERARARAYLHIFRINAMTGLPKGARFAVHGTTAQCLGFCQFLVKYLGMIADSVSVLDEDDSALRTFLHQYDMEGALEKDIFQTSAQMVFADGNIIAKLKARHHQFSGVEINLPTMGYVDVIPKTHLGLQGSLLIVEEILNGLLY